MLQENIVAGAEKPTRTEVSIKQRPTIITKAILRRHRQYN